MSSRHLVATNAKFCIGCQLCVLASSRVLRESLSLTDGFITVSSKGREGFDISIDRAERSDFEEIVKICPRRCFELTPYER
ncbi:hypothetical protein COT49_03440 [candidate division WWE3 bacterium CG08_land_8_20_14_0_20_40_13]|uniref:4Fe-4S ferredoxin-type domain-containing protein n=1 Tax=candidate division WWE3 bacterium CG08_land_8_20_14_0_20_40_13 TaxID=1975084 RepID=A0A2H0XDC6_UNCKA|nr:MAG: hypothetical protein COT49_03440 [candidate division WWE3 bacterium CG08_land_8_20_14_0_20_40_13]